jgi:16S rRNA (cytosine967-C5)-methyltransferase
MKVLKENLERVNLDANLVTTDIFSYKEGEEYDVVLLDAPCSATGTIRRHPDLPFLKGEEELAVLVTLQKKMLGRAREFVKPGGHIFYTVLVHYYMMKGNSQIEEFLLNNSDIYPVKIDYESVGLSKECESLNKSIRTRPDFWSEHGGMDGFFISHMRKKDVLANKN